MDWLPGRKPREPEEPAAPERNLAVEVDQLRWQVDDLRSEVAALRAQVGKLIDHIQRVSARSAGPKPAAETPPRRTAATSVAPDAPPPTDRTVLLDAYREAAADLAGVGETFMAEHQPVGLVWSEADGGWTRTDNPQGAFVWALRHGREYLIVPGYRALKDWRTHFARQREENAADYFGQAFDLDPTPGRFDVTPAVAAASENVLRLKKRGRIQGFI